MRNLSRKEDNIGAPKKRYYHKKMKYRHIRNVSIVVAFALIASFSIARYYGIAPPILKATDPRSPWFSQEHFRFNDYTSRKAKIDAFRKLFPPGSSKEFVDSILVTYGKARNVIPSRDVPNVWIYAEPRRIGIPPGPSHTFIFDSNEKLENIKAFNMEYVYPDRLTKENIRESLDQAVN